MTTAEDLERAMEILDARGWCQGEYVSQDGRVCAEMAVILSCGGSIERDEIDGGAFNRVVIAVIAEPESHRRITGCYEALLSAVGSITGERAGVSWYNDLGTTTVEDVKLMFRHAIEACDDETESESE